MMNVKHTHQDLITINVNAREPPATFIGLAVTKIRNILDPRRDRSSRVFAVALWKKGEEG